MLPILLLENQLNIKEDVPNYGDNFDRIEWDLLFRKMFRIRNSNVGNKMYRKNTVVNNKVKKTFT